MLIPILLPTRV